MKYFYDNKGLLKILEKETQREKIREKIPLPYKEFMKTPFCKNSSDMFGESELMISYNEENSLSEIELYNPEAEFFFLEHQILGMKFKDIDNVLNKLQIRYDIDEYGLVIEDYNMELFIPDINENKEKAIIESICLKNKNIKK